MLFSIWLMFVGTFSGVLGSVLGLGGGVFIVPILTLVLHLDFHTAISMSLCTIIAKSILSTAINIKSKLLNIPLGLLLIPTALIGSTIGGRIGLASNDVLLATLFSIALLLMASLIYLRRHNTHIEYKEDHLFSGSYYENNILIKYTPSNLVLAMITCSFGGFIGGALGIGAGGILVPIMKIFNKLPIKIAAATSIFIMGIADIPPALIYLSKGILNPQYTVFIIIGAFLGAYWGNKIIIKLKDKHVSKIFSAVLIINASIMLYSTYK